MDAGAVKPSEADNRRYFTRTRRPTGDLAWAVFDVSSGATPRIYRVGHHLELRRKYSYMLVSMLPTRATMGSPLLAPVIAWRVLHD